MCDLKSNVELNGFGGFAVDSPESHLFDYNNLAISSMKDSITNPPTLAFYRAEEEGEGMRKVVGEAPATVAMNGGGGISVGEESGKAAYECSTGH
jgi:hypothetical protein